MLNRGEYRLAANPAEATEVEKMMAEVRQQADRNFKELNGLVDAQQAEMLRQIAQTYEVYQGELAGILAKARSAGTVNLTDAQKAIYSEVQASRVVADCLRDQMIALVDYTERIGHVASVVDRLNGVASSVASAAEQQAAATAEIGRNAVEAAKGTQEVSGTIHGVRQAAGTTAAAATQVQSSATELAQRTVQLRDGVSRFIQGVRAA